MNDLYKPIPFYTVEAVNFASNYIDAQSDIPNKCTYRAALEWVKAVLENTSCNGEPITRRDLAAAYRFAQDARENAKLNKEVTAAVVWLYVMTAVSDYANAHKAAA